MTGARKFGHISPVSRELHWLPVGHRITDKVATVVCNCIHGLAPPYLTDDCVPVSTMSGRHLGFADSRCLVVLRTEQCSVHVRNFAIASAVVWNNLPANLNLLLSLCIDFRQETKRIFEAVQTYAAPYLYTRITEKLLMLLNLSLAQCDVSHIDILRSLDNGNDNGK